MLQQIIKLKIEDTQFLPTLFRYILLEWNENCSDCDSGYWILLLRD